MDGYLEVTRAFGNFVHADDVGTSEAIGEQLRAIPDDATHHATGESAPSCSRGSSRTATSDGWMAGTLDGASSVGLDRAEKASTDDWCKVPGLSAVPEVVSERLCEHDEFVVSEPPISQRPFAFHMANGQKPLWRC